MSKIRDSNLLPESFHPFNSAFSRFAQLLERRLNNKVFTTEDAVRYSFFYALTETTGLEPEHIILEHDHGKIERAKIDTWIPEFENKAFALEFKYDRPIPSRGNQPRTQKAGHVFKDLFRLAHMYAVEKIETIFIYLTSHEMSEYFKNPKNGLAEFFDLRAGSTILIDESYLLLRAKTLKNSTGSVIPCVVQSIFNYSLPDNHQLRIYSICCNT